MHSIFRWTAALLLALGMSANAHADDVAAQIRQHSGDHRVIVLGELHGTREVPALLRELMEAYAADGAPVRLALELPTGENPALATYMSSAGTAEARAALRGTKYWTVRSRMHDGRRSEDMLDLIERGTVQAESLSNLHALLGKLSKTLGMVGLSSAGNALAAQLQTVASWSEEQTPDSVQLNSLADAVLYVEGMVASLESGERREPRPAQAQPVSEAESFAMHQLNEARIVVIDEALGGLAMAKRAITAYLESNGDKLHLANVPFTLQAVRGGLWFLDQPRAAQLVGACAEYIDKQMLESQQMPSEQMLETLADALTSLEYYLEGGAVLRPETQPSVLDLAAESVRALGIVLPSVALSPA